MSKDTIYIDVEDDITAIIGKVKGAKSKIVALIPPKRVGVLQSAVNLRLLARAAKQTNRHLVLISGNSALTALAAQAGIPSARTLQSKPELATIPSEDDDTTEDIIDGADLPVGEIARIDGEAIPPKEAPAVDSAIRASNAEAAATAVTPAQPRPRRGGSKVPNFDTFRKRMVLGVGAFALLIGFLVWAIWFAPSATITIAARTIDSSANPKVALATDAKTDATSGTIKSVRQEIKKEVSLAFDATGEKEVGEKAKGQVIIRSCAASTTTIQSGTGVSAAGKTYITQAAVVVPAGSGNWISGCTPGVSSAVAVVAEDIGEDFNIDSGTQFNVAGQPSTGNAWVRATASTDIDGGTKKKVKVVTKEDVDKAAEQVANEGASDMKKQLIEKFGGGVITIDASFAANKDGVTSIPAIDAEAADGKAKLAGNVSYSMIGVANSEAGRFLDDYFAKQIKDKENQRVYNNGAEKTTFVDVVSAGGSGFTATMTATAKFGPKIDDAAVRAEARGKKYGDVQSTIERISGVESVDIKFSPFWVRTVPNDENRIIVKFNLNESK